MADDELIVNIEEEQKAPEQTVEVEKKESEPPPPPPPPDPTEELKTQYEALQREQETRRTELEAARTREEQARRQAEAARRDATQSQAQMIDAQLEGVTSALAGAESDGSGAEMEYAAAMERADYIAAAKAQRKMAAAEARINQLGQQKDYLDQLKKTPQQQRQPQASGGDDVDQWIESLSGPSRDWARNHRDWIADPAKKRKVEAAHLHALGEELVPNSPEYFDHVERRLGLKKGPERNPDTGQFTSDKPAPKRAGAPPSAPVNAGGNGTSAISGNTVTLTQGEARAAQDGTIVWNVDDPTGQKRWRKGDPIGVQEFARRKQALTRQGAYDKTYTEQ
jgi:hypothetical protein